MYRERKVSYQTSNDTTQIKDDPESRNKLALFLLVGITHHDSALGAPQEATTYTQQGTCEDEETDILVVVVGQKGRDIEEITKTPDGQGQAQTDPIGNRASKETNHRKGAVQRRVGIADIAGIDLATTTQATDSVEHSGAEEADKGDEDQLDLGRRKPGECPTADLAGLVHPGLAQGCLVGGFRVKARHAVEVFLVDGAGSRSHGAFQKEYVGGVCTKDARRTYAQ